jgi:hypothetical protein
MSPLRLGWLIAASTALLWQGGALMPWRERPADSLDLQWYFFPAYDAFYGAVRAGAPMLWNPYQLCGMPWLGTLQAGFFYPPHVLYLLLPTPWALALSTALHLALAAGGAAAFARRAGLSATAATLAAAVFGLAGPLRTTQLWPYLLESSAWLPLGALAVLDLTAGGTGGRSRRGSVRLAFASGMSWLAGCPQATVLACYAWLALFTARLLVVRPPIGDAWRATAGVAAGLVGGVLLSAVTLLPALEFAREGMRRTSALDVAAMYPFGVTPPRRIWTLWLSSGSRVLSLAALGLMPLALLSESPALALWGIGLSGLSAAFALGPATPLFRLYLLLPLVGWFRVPSRVLVVGQFALGIVAGLGLDAAARRIRWPYGAPLVVLVLLGAVALGGIRRPRQSWPLPYRADAAPYSQAQRDAYARLASTLDGFRAWPFSPGLLQFSLPPKLPSVARLRSVTDYEPLLLRRQHEYFVFFAEGIQRAPRASDNSIVSSLAAQQGQPRPATRRRLLDLTAVRFMLVHAVTSRRADVAAFLREAGYEARPPLMDGLLLYENPHTVPRAFVTYRASPAPATEELLPILSRASFDPLLESWVEGDPGLGAEGAPRGSAATIVRDDPQAVEIDATLAAPGLVVLADTFYPGWTATVDGAPAPILATNHLFRGVPAPAGTHRIRFAYRPRSLAIGATLSVMTLLALVAATCWPRIRA